MFLLVYRMVYRLTMLHFRLGFDGFSLNRIVYWYYDSLIISFDDALGIECFAKLPVILLLFE